MSELFPVIKSAHELRLIISGLKRLRHQLRSDMRKQKRAGWKPEQGKGDNNALRLEGVERLLARLDSAC